MRSILSTSSRWASSSQIEAGEVLQPHVAPLDERQELSVGVERRLLVFERFAEDVADVVLVALQQRADAEARVPAHPGPEPPTGLGQTGWPALVCVMVERTPALPVGILKTIFKNELMWA